MTVLTAVDQASKLMGFGAVSALFTSADPRLVELAALTNEAAPDIAKRHDWQKLLTLNTETGTGVATAFDIADDYDRMPKKAAVFQTSTSRPMTQILDLDTWRYHRLQSFNTTHGEWIIIGGQIHIFPAMAATDSATFYYITKNIVDPASGSNKAAFTLDTDTFLLPERLLTLSLIWRWRHMKGHDYAEDMQNFEIALAQEIMRDKGSRILASGPARLPGDYQTAFHGTITP